MKYVALSAYRTLDASYPLLLTQAETLKNSGMAIKQLALIATFLKELTRSK